MLDFRPDEEQKMLTDTIARFARERLRKVYRDAEAFKLHWDGESMRTVRTEIGERMVKMTGVRCASA